MARTLALTGATGFIGSALARRLATAGWRIRALYRPNSNLARIENLDIDLVAGALEDPGSLCHLVRDAVAVIHCAGAVRGAARADFEQANVAGLERLVEAAAQQPIPPRFLLISSLAARQPELSFYATSKRQGEEVLRQCAGPMSWTALRPPAVYGAGDRELAPLWRWMERGVAPVLGRTDGRFSLLHVDDLAEAVVCWLESGCDRQEILELHDGREGGYSWSEIIAMVARLQGRRVRGIPVPEKPFGWLAQLNLLIAQTLGYAPMLTPGKVRELRHSDWVCDNTQVSRAIGWRPSIALKEGLRRTLNWTPLPDQLSRTID